MRRTHRRMRYRMGGLVRLARPRPRRSATPLRQRWQMPRWAPTIRGEGERAAAEGGGQGPAEAGQGAGSSEMQP